MRTVGDERGRATFCRLLPSDLLPYHLVVPFEILLRRFFSHSSTVLEFSSEGRRSPLCKGYPRGSAAPCPSSRPSPLQGKHGPSLIPTPPLSPLSQRRCRHCATSGRRSFPRPHLQRNCPLPPLSQIPSSSPKDGDFPKRAPGPCFAASLRLDKARPVRVERHA